MEIKTGCRTASKWSIASSDDRFSLILADALEVLMFLKLAIPIFRGNPCASTE
jgi:hypothetical protein